MSFLPPVHCRRQDHSIMAGIVIAQPQSPLDYLGVFDFQPHYPMWLPIGYHDRRNIPCPYGHTPGGICTCLCFACAHRLRFGNAAEVNTYRSLVVNYRQPDPNHQGQPRIADPPRRVFQVRPTTTDVLPRAGNQWGDMMLLPMELRDMICAFVGDFPAGVAALNPNGLTQNPRDPRSHNDLTLAVHHWPCTETKAPWNLAQNGLPCPNNRTGARRPYQGGVQKCQGTTFWCAGMAVHGYEHYVCRQHFESTKRWWQLDNRANLDKSHKVPPCQYHERQLMRQNPDGLNTCNCENVDFDDWSCVDCFRMKVHKMRINFFCRVEMPYRGEADMSILRPAVAPNANSEVYWSDWRVVREMLAREHPCMHSPVGGCTVKRLGGIHRKRVLDCRCCGGVIVEPRNKDIKRKITRADRGRNRNLDLFELDEGGKAKIQRVS